MVEGAYRVAIDAWESHRAEVVHWSVFGPRHELAAARHAHRGTVDTDPLEAVAVAVSVAELYGVVCHPPIRTRVDDNAVRYLAAGNPVEADRIETVRLAVVSMLDAIMGVWMDGPVAAPTARLWSAIDAEPVTDWWKGTSATAPVWVTDRDVTAECRGAVAMVPVPSRWPGLVDAYRLMVVTRGAAAVRDSRGLVVRERRERVDPHRVETTG